MTAPGSEVQAVIDALEHVDPARVKSIGVQDTERSVLIVRQGYAVHDIKPLLDRYRTAPERRSGVARFTDLDSFIAWTVRFADADSVVFASDDSSTPSLTSVLDYHRATATGAPRYGEHRGHYAFPLSDEWQAWTGKDDTSMSQEDFARFLEDRLGDVADPAQASGGAAEWSARLSAPFASPSRLLELSKGLAVTVTSQVRENKTLSSGVGHVFYATDHTDPEGKSLDIPPAFLLSLPVFRRGDHLPLPVRLRYRIKGGTITWSYQLARVDALFDFALAEALAKVAAATSLPVLRGAPEGK